MNQYYCTECLSVFRKKGKCNHCGSTEVKPITISIQKHTVKD